jgi:hypothetical protein
VVEKSTTVATNLPLKNWNGLRCNHKGHRSSKVEDSSSLSRWPGDMNIQIAKALRSRLDAFPGFKHDRPANSPLFPTTQGATSPRSDQSTVNEHPHEVVRIGFKQRPIRDGGGKPSPGRWARTKRPRSKIAHLGAAILAAQGNAWEIVKSSLAQESRQHPFEDSLLTEVRTIMGSNSSVPDGQPFYLDTISSLAKLGEDPDWEFPLKKYGNVRRTFYTTRSSQSLQM